MASPSASLFKNPFRLTTVRGEVNRRSPAGNCAAGALFSVVRWLVPRRPAVNVVAHPPSTTKHAILLGGGGQPSAGFV